MMDINISDRLIRLCSEAIAHSGKERSRLAGGLMDIIYEYNLDKRYLSQLRYIGGKTEYENEKR